MAESNADSPTTQRAYTLRLRGADPNDHAWRDALWATHEAVNKGAKAFGDWLLILRGGLCHTLADAKVAQGKGKPNRDPTAEERRNRRILLALSWLSVESAPQDGDTHKAFVIASGTDSTSSRDEKVLRALHEILDTRGVKEADLDGWIADCEPSLSAAIRDDAVWVNRSDAFDAARQRVGDSLTREEVWDLLELFFGSQDTYLAPLTPAEDSDSAAAEDKAKDLVQKAGNWLSLRGGTEEGADFSAIGKRYAAVAEAVRQTARGQSGPGLVISICSSLCLDEPSVEGVFKAVSYTGSKRSGRFFSTLSSIAAKEALEPSDLSNLGEAVAAAEARFKEANERRIQNPKGPRPYATVILYDVAVATGFPYAPKDASSNHRQFAVMLDHAARRVSIGHSWIKRAESERQKFGADAERMKVVPDEAKVWLDQFCHERSGSSGAQEGYRIRKRAIEGWKEVVARWGRAGCKTAEDRIAAAREAQADPEIDKFGDIQLFEALADDDALCVWRWNGEATAQPLVDYAAATDAAARQQRFKVPAYRHPDPLAHPVFCDFGNSRWDIRFAVHEAVKAAKNKRKSGGADKGGWLKERHALSMGLWDGKNLDDSLPLRWSCKRLTADMALRQDANDATNTVAVTRADRLGRAAAGARADSPIGILGVFEEKHWNGRLQAPRAQLDAIAQYVAKHGWDAKARQMRSRIRWLVSFSAKLRAAGPWIEYANEWEKKCGKDFSFHPKREENKKLQGRSRLLSWEWSTADGDYIVELGTGPKYDPRGAAYPFSNPTDLTQRTGHAKLILSRLPGLRVLSVDLGHRYAAACAVWETLTIEQINAACRAANHALPAKSDLFLHLPTTGTDGKKRTAIYRRIGADHVEAIDEKTGEVRHLPHPAPWARLDRQFLIKLQGEDRPARKAAPAEIETIRRLEDALGRKRSVDDNLPVRIDELLAAGVDSARLALRRYGDMARIAYAFLPGANRLTPGGGSAPASAEDRQSMILDAIVRWHGFFSGDRWADSWASEQWDRHIKPLMDTDLPAWSEDSGESRRQYRGRIEERLKPAADKLAQGDTSAIHTLWAGQWRTRNAAWRGRTGHLRTLRALLLRRGASADTPAAWNVGGLSLTRIATLKLLYQVQKAYHMRPEPENPRKNIPAKGEDELRDFGRRILEAMERMREQRVKQLASRIAEAALGIGRVKPAQGKRDLQRPRRRVDDPCHAVVIEDLTNYRPEETRTRRENRQLMAWSAAKVKKYLSEACQLHGLHLREVQAGYTSRQDSRTGAPGVRCADVPVLNFLSAPWWRRQVNTAKQKVKRGKGDAREHYLVDLDTKWSTTDDAQRKAAPPLRIPVPGGEIFVSADPRSPAARGLQADLNAAANIGLKAILDPDWPGKWWYVPCSTKDGKPSPDKVKGAACVSMDASLSDPAGEPAEKGRVAVKKKEIVNVWRDPTSTSMGGSWQHTAAYWQTVRSRVIGVLRTANGLMAPAGKTVEPTETPW